jgi:hypothetical protein
LSAAALLRNLQSLLVRLYDAPVVQDAADYLICDRAELQRLLGGQLSMSDEQVLLVQQHDEVRIALYIDAGVLERLAQSDPTHALTEHNLADFCTALEGISHFHYLMWSLDCGRRVSLLELELQAEVDKYASALLLLTRQAAGQFPVTLHARLFDRVGYLPSLDAVSRTRYEEASRHAARYCRSLEQRFLQRRRLRLEAWVLELRRFFRCGHQEKIRQLAIS